MIFLIRIFNLLLSNGNQIHNLKKTETKLMRGMAPFKFTQPHDVLFFGYSSLF